MLLYLDLSYDEMKKKGLMRSLDDLENAIIHGAPLIGGIFTSFTMELLIYRAIYLLWEWHKEVKRGLKE